MWKELNEIHWNCSRKYGFFFKLYTAWYGTFQYNDVQLLNIRGLLEKYPTVFFYANT